jgi:hypothetical protein
VGRRAKRTDQNWNSGVDFTVIVRSNGDPHERIAHIVERDEQIAQRMMDHVQSSADHHLSIHPIVLCGDIAEAPRRGREIGADSLNGFRRRPEGNDITSIGLL